MRTYLHCPAVSVPDRVGEVHQSIGQWLNSRALQDLVRSFGGCMPDGLTLLQCVSWLVQFSDRWDYRGALQSSTAGPGAAVERWVVRDDGDMTESQSRLTQLAARALGLMGMESPCEQHYDFVIVLGGARLANLLRARYAAELIRTGAITSGAVVLLGCMRQVARAERQTTDTYAPGADTEFDLLSRAAERCFDLTGGYDEERRSSPGNSNLNWAYRSYHVSGGMPRVLSLAGPSSQPEQRRANSADTFGFFASRCGVRPGDSVLLVTSQIYVPYQQLEAIRILALPRDLVVETVGHPLKWSGNTPGRRQWNNYLQEIRSTLQSIHRFLIQYPPGDEPPAFQPVPGCV